MKTLPPKAMRLSELYEGRVGKSSNGLYYPVQLPADREGVLTVGVGHVMKPAELKSGLININGQMVNWKSGLNEAHIDNLFVTDKRTRWADIQKYLPKDVTEDEAAACLFAYFNTPNAIIKGTPGREFRAGNKKRFAAGFLLYTKSDGKHRLGLFRRQMSCADLGYTGTVSKPGTKQATIDLYRKLNSLGIIEIAKQMNAAQRLGIPFFAEYDKYL